MDARLDEAQERLRDSARGFLSRECPMRFVRDMMDDPVGTNEAVWMQLAGLGWTGLVVPERYGGAGLGWLDLAVLFEETGAALLPGPLFSTVALGGNAIACAGSAEQCERWLEPLAAGTLRATLALQEPGGGATGPVRLTARRADGGFLLSGAKAFVSDAQGADLVVVAARRERADGPLLLAAVPAAASGLRIRPVAYTDATRKLAELTLDDVFVPEEAILGGERDATAALEAALDRARVALGAEMCGLASRVLELSVAHARTREQFGKPIGSFQAIQHKCADMLLRVENMRSAVWYAAWALDEDEQDAHLAACMVQAYASEACSDVAGEGIQIHGGQGYTWEQDLHLYYKRAKADEVALGDGALHREHVARVAVDGG